MVERKYFCEKCNCLSGDDRCAVCGKKKLREVREDDFCYFTTLHVDSTRIFEEALKSENIPVASLGRGLDLRTSTSRSFRMFVPYAFLDRAKEIYDVVFGQQD